jgi:hypothetical protein
MSIVRRSSGWALILGLIASSHAISGQTETSVDYPDGYRRWAHVKSQLIGPDSPFFSSGGGIHHIYANELALVGYRSGRFPDGSILVFDLLETKTRDGITSEGARERLDVMVKDAKRFPESGGWGFERFMGDSRTERGLTKEHRDLCFQCHSHRKDSDFVFSEYHP